MSDFSKQLFPYGSPVTGSKLIGREESLKIILNELRGKQNLLLPGPRRIGKSSVILECLSRLSKEGYLTAYIDIAAINTKREFAKKIASAILASNNSRLKRMMQSWTTKLKDLFKIKEFKVAYNDFEFIASLYEPQSDEEELLAQAFDFLESYAQKRKKQLICAFDEFGEIHSIDSQLIKKMRSQFQLHKNVVYLFTGSQESILEHIFSNPKEPFFGFTKQVLLPPIKTELFVKYLIKTFKMVSITLSDEFALGLCRLVNTHPFYTKVFANAVYEYVALNNIKKITINELRIGFIKAYFSLKPQMEALWFELGKSSRFLRRVCQHLALYETESLFSKEGLKQEADSAHISQALKQLEKKGVIHKIKPGHYIFNNYFFREFILALYHPLYFEDWSPPLKPKNSS